MVDGFVPDKVFDFHTHLFRTSDYQGAAQRPFMEEGLIRDAGSLRRGLNCWLPNRSLRCLCFGIAARGMDCHTLNEWLASEVQAQEGWKRLALAGPGDDPARVEDYLSGGGFSGLKVSHLLSSRRDSFHCGLEEFAPEWMWEILHAHRGVMMVHIVKDTAMADPENQAAVRRLCRRYPGCQLVMAHVARSFSHRHAMEGLQYLRDLDNVWLDTSAVCESQAFSAALETLGPERMLFGSDFPVSNFRGRAITLANSFHWMYEDEEDPAREAVNKQLSLVGLESLSALREASENCGLDQTDLEGIFYSNALRVLGEESGRVALAWEDAREHVACGTGLMSKRQEQYDTESWPTFFSRCHGSEVWDQDGRRFVDFAGGVGAILLGYCDGEIERALRRRLSAGTYCTLVNPGEDKLARLLLRLHPWAGRIRFARGGGEAMAIAVRISRAATGRSGVAFCGYHGWHDWYLAANLGDNSALDGHLLPGLTPLGVPRELKGTAAAFTYNNVGTLRKAIADLGGAPAAVVMEPMRSHLPQEDFIAQVQAIAAESGAIFILDEVTSGLRFGFPGAHSRLGFEPDMAVYAKAMSNGFPCGAIVGRKEIMDAANPSFISSSYWTDAMGTSAALACLRKIEREEVSSRIWESGREFFSALEEVASLHKETRMTVGGMPPSPSITFALGSDSAAAKVLMIRGLVQRGFLGSSQIYLMQSHTSEQKLRFLDALDSVVREIGNAIRFGTLAETAGSLPVSGSFARLV